MSKKQIELDPNQYIVSKADTKGIISATIEHKISFLLRYEKLFG